MTQKEKTVSGRLFRDPYYSHKQIPLGVKTKSGAYFTLAEILGGIVGKDVKITIEDSCVIIEEVS